MIKRKLIAISMMCVLFLPVQAIEEQTDFEPQNSQEFEVTTPEETAELENSNPISAEETILPEKTPTESGFKVPSGKKQLAKKFIIAMLCVAGCSVFLYLTLSVYNRIRDGFIADDTALPEGEEPLEAPQDLTEAVKTFVDKTHGNGV